MPDRFLRSLRILPGVRLNLSARGARVQPPRVRTGRTRLSLPLFLILGMLASCWLCSFLATGNEPPARPHATPILRDTAPQQRQAPAAPVALAGLLPTVTPVPGSLGLAEPLDVAGWNVGLDDADAQVIGAALAAFQGVDLWGLAEVNRPALASTLTQAAAEGEGATFDYVLGDSGGGMYLLAIYDAERFDLLESWEIDAINTTGNARAPLVLHLQERSTGFAFLFMVNHLYRSRDDERHTQAQLLNAWAAKQQLPVVAVGDYNFDWAITDGAGDHDLGYDLMTAHGAWDWVEPNNLVTTQCSGWPCRYESVLDFVFTAGPARAWPGASQIVILPGDFPDDTSKSDHRPVLATFTVGDAAAVAERLQIVAPVAAPTQQPTPIPPTPTPLSPAGPVANASANLRSGPGTGYPVAGGVAAGTPLRITGRNAAGDWLRLADGTWIAASLVNGAPGGLVVVAPRAAPVRAQVVAPVSNCDPSYPSICIPVGVGDLDCGEIPYRRFAVVGADPHGFDGDGDGVGCER